MSQKHIPISKQGRPTRDEINMVILETCVKIKHDIRKLENLYKREFNYVTKKTKKSSND